MATINFESRGSRQAGKNGSGPPQTTTGIDTTGIPGYGTKDRLINVTPTISAVIKIPPGWYEHVGESSNGDWTYAACNRGHV